MANKLGIYIWHRDGSIDKSRVAPLLVTVVGIAILLWVGYQIMATMARFKDDAARRMGKKDVVWTRHGVRVGVRPLETENYIDKTQKFVVMAWNLGRAAKDEGKQGKGSPKERKDKK